MSSPAVRPRQSACLDRFAAEERGGIIIFSLFLLVAMLLVTATAIDTVRFETTRTKLQNTLDRAVLAAADLDQTLVPDDVVADYFAKAGMPGLLTDTNVSSGLSHRTVSAEAEATIGTYLLKLVGTETLKVPTSSEANETVEDVEISLVLDISGSMRFDDRITPLRAAANEFIEMVLSGDRAEDTTISVVPYAGQTNPGPLLFTLMGGARDHSDSSCLFLDSADFTHTGLPGASTRQMPHFMKWTIAWSHMDWGWCPSDATSILPFSNDAAALTSFIDNMRLHDGTGTHIGMKYGLALLDPTSRDEISALRAAEIVPAMAAGRPLDWEADSGKKYIVLMTDGKITDQFEPKYTSYDGPRDVDADDEDNEPYEASGDDEDGIDHNLYNATVELDNQRDTSGKKGGNTQKVTSRSTNLSRFYAICDAAKANQVIIYTIAFEAPADAAEEMRNCASTPANFFEVDQLEIDEAFNSIARQINQLRLTQ